MDLTPSITKTLRVSDWQNAGCGGSIELSLRQSFSISGTHSQEDVMTFNALTPAPKTWHEPLVTLHPDCQSAFMPSVGPSDLEPVESWALWLGR